VNKVLLAGRLTRDPEMRALASSLTRSGSETGPAARTPWMTGGYPVVHKACQAGGTA